MGKEIKQLLYTDDMIIIQVYITKELAKILLELISGYIKIAEYKVNTQKSIAFLGANNE